MISQYVLELYAFLYKILTYETMYAFYVQKIVTRSVYVAIIYVSPNVLAILKYLRTAVHPGMCQVLWPQIHDCLVCKETSFRFVITWVRLIGRIIEPLNSVKVSHQLNMQCFPNKLKLPNTFLWFRNSSFKYLIIIISLIVYTATRSPKQTSWGLSTIYLEFTQFCTTM